MGTVNADRSIVEARSIDFGEDFDLQVTPRPPTARPLLAQIGALHASLGAREPSQGAASQMYNEALLTLNGPLKELF
jgi:hypothetical protein